MSLTSSPSSVVIQWFGSCPRWVRVSALVVGFGAATEVAAWGYRRWRGWCVRRRSRNQLTEVFFANERSCLANTPGMTMTSFTTEHVRRIVALVDRARVSVWLCMYIVTVESIGDALLRARERGVLVRVVGCASMAYSSGSQMTKLVEGDIPVRFNRKDGAYLMHHKFCLIDTDWMCPRCYHGERVRKNGFCCEASAGGVGGGDGPDGGQKKSGDGANGDEKPVKIEEEEKPRKYGQVPPAPRGRKVGPCRLDDEPQGCVRCSAKIRQQVEKSKLSDGAGGELVTDPLPLGGIIITGSTNWTMQALSGNWDNMIVTSYPAIVTPFQLEFQRLWREFAHLPRVVTGGGGQHGNEG